MYQDNPIYISAAQEYMSYQSQLQQETQAKIDAGMLPANPLQHLLLQELQCPLKDKA